MYDAGNSTQYQPRRSPISSAMWQILALRFRSLRYERNTKPSDFCEYCTSSWRLSFGPGPGADLSRTRLLESKRKEQALRPAFFFAISAVMITSKVLCSVDRSSSLFLVRPLLAQHGLPRPCSEIQTHCELQLRQETCWSDRQRQIPSYIILQSRRSLHSSAESWLRKTK